MINVDQAKIMSCYKLVDRDKESYGNIIVIKHQPNGDIFVIIDNGTSYPTLGYDELLPPGHSDWSGLIKTDKKKRDKLLHYLFDKLFSDDRDYVEQIHDDLELYL